MQLISEYQGYEEDMWGSCGFQEKKTNETTAIKNKLGLYEVDTSHKAKM